MRRRMCRDLPTCVSPLLDFLWDSEHRTGTDRASRRMVVACLEPLRGRIPGARKSHLSRREWSRAAALRPGWDLCPLAGKRESQCRGANKRDPEGNYFSRPAMVKSPRVGGQRRPASPDALRWTEGPSAEVGEQQVAAQQTAGDRRPLPVDRAPGLKEKTLILLDVSTKNPVRTVNENFLSLQLDPSIIHDGWLDFLSSKRLVTLARGLSPAFLRFGGKRTDFLQFQNLRNPAKSRGGPGPDYYLKNYEDDIVRSDVALDKQKGCKIAQHPDVMLELQREKAAQMHLVLLKEQFSNTYSNLILTGNKKLNKLKNQLFIDLSEK